MLIMIKQEHLSKKSYESDPDGQKKIKLFLKNLQNDIIEKETGGFEVENTKYEKASNESP